MQGQRTSKYTHSMMLFMGTPDPPPMTEASGHWVLKAFHSEWFLLCYSFQIQSVIIVGNLERKEM